jgi:hypothetical protein
VTPLYKVHLFSRSQSRVDRYRYEPHHQILSGINVFSVDERCVVCSFCTELLFRNPSELSKSTNNSKNSKENIMASFQFDRGILGTTTLEKANKT